MRNQWPNQSRACVKTPMMKIGNDQIFVVAKFDEMRRRIQWSENEFSHSLSPEPTVVGAVHAASRRWFRFLH